jgi:hypothetical protein
MTVYPIVGEAQANDDGRSRQVERDQPGLMARLARMHRGGQ